MRKRSIIAALLAATAVLAPACSKSAGPGDGDAARGEVLLSVSFRDPSTKVGSQSAANEKAIQNVQVFVFRAGLGGDAGNLEVAASAGFDTPIGATAGSWSGMTVKCSTGQREVWAVVNDSRDRTRGSDAVATKGDFLALTHELKDNAEASLLMIGHSGTDAAPAVELHEGREELTIGVRRMVAAVILESVTNDFLSPAYQKADMFRLEACYLLNVPGRVDFALTSEPSALPQEDWYARLARETDTQRARLIADPLEGQMLQYGKTYSVPHTFYTYPNNCAVSEDAAWSPRATVLVLEASLYNGHDWAKYYYPVQLGTSPLRANRQYRVNLTVHRPGSLDPNTSVRFDDLTPVVTVSDWESGEVYDQDI
jgi:hypothetical protein